MNDEVMLLNDEIENKKGKAIPRNLTIIIAYIIIIICLKFVDYFSIQILTHTRNVINTITCDEDHVN